MWHILTSHSCRSDNVPLLTGMTSSHHFCFSGLCGMCNCHGNRYGLVLLLQLSQWRLLSICRHHDYCHSGYYCHKGNHWGFKCASTSTEEDIYDIGPLPLPSDNCDQELQVLHNWMWIPLLPQRETWHRPTVSTSGTATNMSPCTCLGVSIWHYVQR